MTPGVNCRLSSLSRCRQGRAAGGRSAPPPHAVNHHHSNPTHSRVRGPRVALPPSLPALLLLLLPAHLLVTPEAARTRLLDTASGSDTGARRTNCPDWLQSYIEFHRANRLAPDAKYLIHTCYNGICGGVGDRLRGALWSARLAVATRRVVLVAWRRPMELTHFMRPASIDWTLEGIPSNALTRSGAEQAFHRVTWLDSAPPSELTDGSLENVRTLELEHNSHEDKPAGPGAPEMQLWSDEAACLFQALFRPSEMVEDMIQKELSRLLTTPSPTSAASAVQPQQPAPQLPPYGALHIRIGGLQGEGEGSITLHQISRLTYFLQTLSCLQGLITQNNITVTTTNGDVAGADAAAAASTSVSPSYVKRLVVADSNLLRRRVADGVLPGLVAPSFEAAHLDTVGLADAALHATTFASLGLLARARCAVYTDSGFSRLAYYLGRQNCAAVLPRYSNEMALPPTIGKCSRGLQ